MIHFLKNFVKITKDKINQNSYLAVKIGCMIITAFVFAGFPGYTAKAASGLRIYDYTTERLSTYTGKQVKVTCNGTTIGSSKYPGILVDGVSLLPAYDIFDKLPIDADYTYNSKDGSITISKYNITILMKIGSTKATVNGKTVTLSVAPKKIKYIDTDTVKVLIPSRFVAEALGLSYSWNNTKNTVAIVKHTLELSYNGGKNFEYKGAQGKVTFDGKTIALGKAPSLIINDTAMLSAYKVFAHSKIGATYTYNKADQSITLSKGDNVLVMTIGSLEAVYNNKKITLPAAPAMVKYQEANTSYVLVPGYITATCLGYNYSWNNPSRTSAITSKEKASDHSDETDTVLNQWTSNSPYGESSGISELNGATSGNNGVIYSVSRDTSNTKQNAETFMIISSAPFQKLTSAKSGKKITVQASSQSCSDQTYQMYGVTSNFINTISTYNNMSDLSSTIDIEVLQEDYNYDISLSADQQVLSVTVYLNTIKSAFIGTNSKGDNLTLSGIKPLNAAITEESEYIHIDLPYTINNLGYLNAEIKGSKYIKQFFTISMQDKTQIILLMNEGYQYSTSTNGNDFTISFKAKGNNDTPAAIDKSKYNIVIPKPTNINSSMISNIDYYFNHYFDIILEGDYTDYFNKNSITNKASKVSKIAVSLNSSGNTVIKIATSELQGYEIASDNANIYVRVGNPRDIYKNIVVLDPGHGGPATGALRNGKYEKDINLQILYTVGKKYFNQDTSKLKVYWTRTSDVDMSLNDRAAFVKKVGADLFVSLHMNSVVSNTSVEGTEVFYSKANNSANKAGLTSSKLAAILDSKLVNVLGTNDRGVKQDAFVVIKKNTVPAVLIELGFLTNKKDFSIITNEYYQNISAETIYETLLQVFEKYPTGR